MTSSFVYRHPNGEVGFEKSTINWRLQFNKVRDVFSHLNKNKLIEQWKQGPFSWMLGLYNGNQLLSGRLVMSLLAREILVEKEKPHEMWFEVGGVAVRFGMEEYAIVTGLCFGKHDNRVHQSKKFPPGGVYDRCFFEAVKPPVLLQRIAAADFPREGDLLKCIYVYVAHILTSRQNTRDYIQEYLWNLVDNLDTFCAFPWGSYLMERDIASWRLIMEKPRVTIDMPGFVWALQWWAMEALNLEDIFGPKVGTGIPRCMNWFCNKKPTEWKSRLDAMKGAQKFLAPSEDEKSSRSYQSVLDYKKQIGHSKVSFRVSNVKVAKKISYIDLATPTHKTSKKSTKTNKIPTKTNQIPTKTNKIPSKANNPQPSTENKKLPSKANNPQPSTSDIVPVLPRRACSPTKDGGDIPHALQLIRSELRDVKHDCDFGRMSSDERFSLIEHKLELIQRRQNEIASQFAAYRAAQGKFSASNRGDAASHHSNVLSSQPEVAFPLNVEDIGEDDINQCIKGIIDTYVEEDNQDVEERIALPFDRNHSESRTFSDKLKSMQKLRIPPREAISLEEKEKETNIIHRITRKRKASRFEQSPWTRSGKGKSKKNKLVEGQEVNEDAAGEEKKEDAAVEEEFGVAAVDEEKDEAEVEEEMVLAAAEEELVVAPAEEELVVAPAEEELVVAPAEEEMVVVAAQEIEEEELLVQNQLMVVENPLMEIENQLFLVEKQLMLLDKEEHQMEPLKVAEEEDSNKLLVRAMRRPKSRKLLLEYQAKLLEVPKDYVKEWIAFTNTPKDRLPPKRDVGFLLKVFPHTLRNIQKKTFWFTNMEIDMFIFALNRAMRKKDSEFNRNYIVHSTNLFTNMAHNFEKRDEYVINEEWMQFPMGKIEARRSWNKAKYVLLPCFVSNHWILAKLDLACQKIYLFDSMGKGKSTQDWRLRDTECLAWFLPRLLNVSGYNKTVYGEDKDMEKWDIEHLGDIVPQQPDSSSCGAYMCKFILHILKYGEVNWDANVSPIDIREEISMFIYRNSRQVTK